MIAEPLKRALSIAALLFGIGIGCFALDQPSHAQFGGMLMQQPGAGGGYVGLGDVQSG